jgi:hypothetical protein
LHYAKELAELSYVTLAPDYPNFGDYRFDPYQHGYASATMKGILNHMRAIDLLQSLPVVLPQQIGCIGHSLGGHNTLFVAAFDNRVRVLATSCGFTTFANHHNGDLSDWSHKGYMPRIAEIYHNKPAEMPFDFPEVLALMAPRPVFINAPLRDLDMEVSGVRVCVEKAMILYKDLYRIPNKLVVEYPDAPHDFPPKVRQLAYRFLKRWLS